MRVTFGKAFLVASLMFLAIASQPGFGDEKNDTFLSLPQDCSDPTARGRRVSYRAPFWSYASYHESQNDPGLSGVRFATPGGILGTANVQSQQLLVAAQLDVSQTGGMDVLAAPFGASCAQIDPMFNCIKHLDSYLQLYEALDPEYQPAGYKFYDSDYAFARERITASPLFIKRVDSVGQIPFDEKEIVGYGQITNSTSLEDLVAQQRLFIVDFSVYHKHGLLEAADYSYLEVPIGLFFLDQPTGKFPKKSNARLMPLAIKFTVYNQNVYSPLDSHADWFLAKAIFNVIDVDINAIVHFVLHFVVVNIAIAAQKNLANEHPLFRPIQQASTLNSGIILSGVVGLLADGGAFDTFMYLSGASIKEKLLPFLLNQFDWEGSFLKTDLESRGVSDIPGFLYRDDAGALYRSLKKYVQSYLSPFYKQQGSVTADEELRGFLNDLSSDPSALSFIPGFPTSSDVTSLKDVTIFLTQILWITGVDHHALNSYRIIDYDFVYPSHPQKILSQPPAAKGQLTDDDVLHQFIAKPFPLTSSRRRRLSATEGRERPNPYIPWDYIAQAQNLSHRHLSTTDGERHNPYIPWEYITQAQQNLTTTTTAASSADAANFGEHAIPIPSIPPPPIQVPMPSIATFVATQLFGFVFWPLLQQTDRITNIYFSDTSFKNSAAASRLRDDLISLSQSIKNREAATDDAPGYLLLDPERLPFYFYI